MTLIQWAMEEASGPPGSSANKPEKELSIKIGDVNRVHVDDIYVSESGQGEVFEELAAQATSSNDQDPAVVFQEWKNLPKDIRKDSIINVVAPANGASNGKRSN